MYYIEPKDSDSIELQKACTLEGLLDFTSSLACFRVNDFNKALEILKRHGYIVFEDVE